MGDYQNQIPSAPGPDRMSFSSQVASRLDVPLRVQLDAAFDAGFGCGLRAGAALATVSFVLTALIFAAGFVLGRCL